MKIVFFGTPELAGEILKGLMDSEYVVCAVVTQPDRAKGRSGELIPSPVKVIASGRDIPVFQPEKVSDEGFLRELECLGADLFVVAAYAQKLPNAILEMAPLGCINVHPSLLPKYRGATPLVAAILNGDAKSGVSIMKMAEKMDAGDIYLQKEIELDPKETPETLERKAIQVGKDALLEVIGLIKEGKAMATPQPQEVVSYIKQLSKSDGEIDFSTDAASIERKIRAFTPWPGTYTYLGGKLFKILEADVLPEIGKSEARPGTVVYNDGETLAVKCLTDCLALTRVQMEGKKAMEIREFLRGRKVPVGEYFGH